MRTSALSVPVAPAAGWRGLQKLDSEIAVQCRSSSWCAGLANLPELYTANVSGPALLAQPWM